MQDQNRAMMVVAAVVVLLLVVVVAFLIWRNNDSNADNANTTSSSSISVESSTSSLESQSFVLDAQNNSGQSGSVLLEKAGSQLRVIISLSNPTTTPEPAHIHSGSCPNPGAIVYPLTDVVNGTSVTLIDTTMEELLNSGDLAVNVHKSAAESNVYFACGNLSF